MDTMDTQAQTKAVYHWGIYPDTPVRCMWGARAIFRGGEVDLVWDRQSMICPVEDRESFIAVVESMLDIVRRYARNMGQDSDEKDVFTFRGVTVQWSPQRSYGYLYIGVSTDGPLPELGGFSVDGKQMKATRLRDALAEARKGRTRKDFELTLDGIVVAKHDKKWGWKS